MEEDIKNNEFIYYNDEWNNKEIIIINGVEQINIGTLLKPYYIPKPTSELIEHFTIIFKKNNLINDKKHNDNI